MTVQDNVDDFFDFITQRQSIFHKRFELRQSPPWTEDEILQRYLFDNVYRELDRGSLWFITHVARPDFYTASKSVVFDAILYRWFNRPETFKLIHSWIPQLNLSNWTYDDNHLVITPPLFRKHYKKILKALRDANFSVTSHAYTISSHLRGVQTYEYVCKHILLPLTTLKGVKLLFKITNSKTPEEAYNLLRSIKGMGGTGFLAAQVLCDINYSRVFPFDIEQTFVVSGPGAHRGISRIVRNQAEAQELVPQIPLLREVISDIDIIHALRGMSTRELSDRDFPFFRGRKLSLQGIETSLCEYDKYKRMQEFQAGTGRRASLRKFNWTLDKDTQYLSMLNSPAMSSLYNEWAPK